MWAGYAAPVISSDGSPRVRVVYVCSWGRSGSTIVDRVLGQVAGAVSVGELRSLWDADPATRRCGCGALLAGCRLWQPVLYETVGDSSARALAWVRELRDRCARSRHVPALVRRQRAAAPIPATARQYVDVLVSLYRRVLAHQDATVIVDSSKHPAEAALLASCPDVELTLLHLVRDPRAVAFSWQASAVAVDDRDRPPPRGPLSSSAWWTLWNGAADRLGGALGDRYRRIRYEDVMVDPKREVTSLAEWAFGPGNVPPFSSERCISLGFDHTVAGNPNRFVSGPVRLEADRRWETALSPSATLMATLPALPLLRALGYRLRRSGGGDTVGTGRS